MPHHQQRKNLSLKSRLASTLAHLFGHRSKSDSKPKNALLERLPVELLQSTACQLPVSSAASLALCNKYICYVVGRHYWHALRSQPIEKDKFLTIIERDLPSHWLCHLCSIFYPRPADIMQYSPFRTTSPVPKCIDFSRYSPTRNTFHPHALPMVNITHPMVHLAMDHHLFGPEHGEPLDFFSQKEIMEGLRSDLATQACIVANEFYLRWQYRVVVPSSEDSKYIRYLHICPHLCKRAVGNDAITRLVECMLSHRDSGPCERCGGLRQCQYCFTEFEMGIYAIETVNHVLEITSWKNLGPGRTPNDPKWGNHVLQILQRDYVSCRTPVNFSPGNIRANFESYKARPAVTNTPKPVRKRGWQKLFDNLGRRNRPNCDGSTIWQDGRNVKNDGGNGTT